MPGIIKKHHRKKLVASKPKILSSIIHYFTIYPRIYLLARLSGTLLLLLIVIFIGDLATWNGLILILATIGYLLMMLSIKRINNKDDE